MIVCLNSSSFCSKRHENILDQGFLLGPSDNDIFPSTVPPVPVRSTFNLKRNGYPHQWKSILTQSCFSLSLSLQMSKEWETVVCGQTKDQLIMTEKARRYLRSLKSRAPNRALILSWDMSHLYTNMLHMQNLMLLLPAFPVLFAVVICGGEKEQRFRNVFEQVISNQNTDNM